MTIWRFGRGWKETELRDYLRRLDATPLNFEATEREMTTEHGWIHDGAEFVIGYEEPGPPLVDGPFARASTAVMNYDFSDPRLVTGHFDPKAPFVGRNMLLEIRAWGLHYLCGVRVAKVCCDTKPDRTTFGFRYDTLKGHIERGSEWFFLWKNHETGEIGFKIAARWRLGDFPNWWSHLGFRTVGQIYRIIWRHRAPRRLTRVIHQKAHKPIASPGHLAHRGSAFPERTNSTEPRSDLVF